MAIVVLVGSAIPGARTEAIIFVAALPVVLLIALMAGRESSALRARPTTFSLASRCGRVTS